jgi:hypothetical protein
MAVRKFLDISTLHLTAETRARFDDGAFIAQTYPHPDGLGWLMYVADPESEDPDLPWPDDLKACLERARKLDCDYILLDCDAETDPELHQYPDEETTEDEG